MTQLLEIRSLILNIYKRYEKVINVLAKFVIMFFVFSQVNGFFGESMLNRGVVNLALAVAALVLSPKWIVLLLIFLVTGQTIFVSIEAALVLFALMMTFYLLFARMYPKLSFFILAVPICYFLKIPLVVPIAAGLFFGLEVIIPVVLGVIAYHSVPVVPSLLSVSSGLEDIFNMPIVMIDMLQTVLTYMVNNKELIATAIIFVGVIIVTYILRRLSIDYAAYIAMISGVLLYIIGMVMSIIIMKIDLNPFFVIIQGIFSSIIVMSMQFFKVVLNYPKSETVQFEDDDYYYYVKAVPKVKMRVPQKKQVKKITSIKGNH
ncbi:hypothetical protein [Vallitalea okinawensis]|uniref:hypothetical protein n=1 Tax=Vallitalea okinawensis TaxID=2078660 RepID=UPI000CFD9A94|nr:hypothetical protein [Vallitalea okinawensis]